MNATESRITTICMGCFGVASVAVFAAVYGPSLSVVRNGQRHPTTIQHTAAIGLVLRQGLVDGVHRDGGSPVVRPAPLLRTIHDGVRRSAIGRLPKLTEWLLMGSRGIYGAD